MIKRFLTTTALFTMVTQNAIAVNGPNLGITSAVLQALENPARSSINKVESLFAQKQGEVLSIRTLASAAAGAAGGTNAYIESIKVNPNYVIKMTLRGVGDSKTASHKNGATSASPALNAVPKILHGASFYLVPIFTKGVNTARNNAITSWECVTDADEVVNRFVGEKAPTDGDLSYINRYTQSPYLSHCVYASKATLANLNSSF